jgi:hypothetical protein
MVSIEPWLDYILVTKYKGSFFMVYCTNLTVLLLTHSIIVPVLYYTSKDM